MGTGQTYLMKELPNKTTPEVCYYCSNIAINMFINNGQFWFQCDCKSDWLPGTEQYKQYSGQPAPWIKVFHFSASTS